MSAWDDEPTPPLSGNKPQQQFSIMQKPRSQQMQSAAVLQGLVGNTNPPPDTSVDSDAHDPSAEQVNQLNVAMSAMMNRGGGMKLKMLKREPAKNNAQSQGNSNGGAAIMDREQHEQRLSEQRERQYEETRAAIFGGQLDAFRQQPAASPTPSANSTAAAAAALLNNQSQMRISKRTNNSSPPTADAPSVSPDSTHPASSNNSSFYDSAAEEAAAAAAAIQPSAAALAEVHHHHSKRNEKAKAVASKNNRGGRGGNSNHRIIEDLVKNQNNANVTMQNQQQRGNSDLNDPDFQRRGREYIPPPQPQTQPQAPMMYNQQQSQAYNNPQQQSYPYSSAPYQLNSASAPFVPMAVGMNMYPPQQTMPIAPGNAHFAAGPAHNAGVGFNGAGRGKFIQQPRAAPHAFTAASQAFYPQNFQGAQPIVAAPARELSPQFSIPLPAQNNTNNNYYANVSVNPSTVDQPAEPNFSNDEFPALGGSSANASTPSTSSWGKRS